MMKFNKLCRALFNPGVVLAVFAALALTACDVKVDETLGSNLVPENQQMKAG